MISWISILHPHTRDVIPIIRHRPWYTNGRKNILYVEDRGSNWSGLYIFWLTPGTAFFWNWTSHSEIVIQEGQTVRRQPWWTHGRKNILYVDDRGSDWSELYVLWLTTDTAFFWNWTLYLGVVFWEGPQRLTVKLCYEAQGTGSAA